MREPQPAGEPQKDLQEPQHQHLPLINRTVVHQEDHRASHHLTQAMPQVQAISQIRFTHVGSVKILRTQVALRMITHAQVSRCLAVSSPLQLCPDVPDCHQLPSLSSSSSVDSKGDPTPLLDASLLPLMDPIAHE